MIDASNNISSSVCLNLSLSVWVGVFVGGGAGGGVRIHTASTIHHPINDVTQTRDSSDCRETDRDRSGRADRQRINVFARPPRGLSRLLQ